MATTARCCFVLAILGASVQVEGLWNFRAVGEYLTVDVNSCSEPFSVDSARYFEEVYYSSGASINKTALRIDSEDVDASAFFGDLKEGNVFLQLGNEDCRKVTKNDSDLPEFKAWGLESEAIYAPVYVTLTELKYLVIEDSLVPVKERGLSALRAQLNLTEKSNPNYNVETAFITLEGKEGESYDYESLIPLSIELCVLNNGTRTIERLSIVEFAWNTTTEEDASPPAGTRCDGYGRSDLPEIFDVSTLVLRTEQVLNGNVTTGDIALDFERKLLRIDNGVNDYFLSTSQQLIYNVANPDSRIQSCEISEAGKVQKLDWTFVDFSAKSAKDFFGVNENFKIKTRTKRRGIECDLISGVRDYLPEKGAPSVWEWCVGEMQTADGVRKYMVHLDISIRPLGGPLYQESYSLYDVESVEQKKLYLDYFTELEPCFGLDRKINLQVTVDGQQSSSYAEEDFETAIESTLFKAELLDTMLKESGLEPDSYRFGSTEAYILDSRDAVFQFYLLDAPPNAPEDQRVDSIYKKLQKAVSESVLTVDVNGIKFSIRKDSLTQAHDMDQRITTPSSVTGSPEPPTSENPSTPTTLEPDTSTTEQDHSKDLPEVTVGYHGGLVWGVAFAILLFGGGVGVVAGNKMLIK